MSTANQTINSTGGQTAGMSGAHRKLHVACLVIYCLILIVGTLGNSLVIYVTGFKMKKTVNSVLFLNLALADFLFTAFLIFSIISLYQGQQWHFGRLMCKLNNLVNLVNMFASVFLLTAIALDRCLTIWVVVWAHNKRTVRKAQIASAVIWLAALVCSIPYANFREIMVRPGKIFCSYSASREQLWILGIFRFALGFLIPFLIICVSYAAISVRAGRLRKTRKHRPRKVILSVILAFFICWMPFHVLHFIELANRNPDIRNIIRIVGPLALNLAFMNSCLNPILYVFMCEEFQKKLKRSVCFVLESALAEDHLSFVSSRSLSSHLSRISRKSDPATPLDKKGTDTIFNFKDSKVVIAEERVTLSTE
ncbi:chemerin-like receptor 1 [Pempheris klunzingeri]|uniref:chemerin-like receptor 1 n=1 Tax=Pempheris klunzingeri TaxID=3127111 RepID=UPI003980C745